MRCSQGTFFQNAKAKNLTRKLQHRETMGHLWAVRARCPLQLLVDCWPCLCPPPSLCRSRHRRRHSCRRCRRRRCVVVLVATAFVLVIVAVVATTVAAAATTTIALFVFMNIDVSVVVAARVRRPARAPPRRCRRRARRSPARGLPRHCSCRAPVKGVAPIKGGACYRGTGMLIRGRQLQRWARAIFCLKINPTIFSSVFLPNWVGGQFLVRYFE